MTQSRFKIGDRVIITHFERAGTVAHIVSDLRPSYHSSRSSWYNLAPYGDLMHQLDLPPLDGPNSICTYPPRYLRLYPESWEPAEDTEQWIADLLKQKDLV